MPPWAIPIHWVIALILGSLLTLFIEEPARNFLKKHLTKRKEKIQLPEKDVPELE